MERDRSLRGFLDGNSGIGDSKGYGVLVKRLRFDFRHRDCGIEDLRIEYVAWKGK